VSSLAAPPSCAQSALPACLLDLEVLELASTLCQGLCKRREAHEGAPRRISSELDVLSPYADSERRLATTTEARFPFPFLDEMITDHDVERPKTQPTGARGGSFSYKKPL